MQSIIHSYHNTFSGGIGDFLRGSIHLYKQCKEDNLNMSIDFRHHPVGEFIYSDCQDKYDSTSIFDIEKITVNSSETLNVIGWENKIEKVLEILWNNSPDSKPLILATYYIDVSKNANFLHSIKNYVLSEDCQLFFQKQINFSKEVEEMFSELQLSNYSVIHYRLGDRHTLKDLPPDLPKEIHNNYNLHKFNHDYNLYYATIEKYLDDHSYDSIVVMSDSNHFKKFVQNKNNDKIKVVHLQSCHTSNNPGLLKYTTYAQTLKRDELLHTALDLKILTQSKESITYSSYLWGSGFVTWISKIFNVPVTVKHIFSNKGPQ